jgi:predicted  nucleic acid-binding Zn-ribbon protein
VRDDIVNVDSDERVGSSEKIHQLTRDHHRVRDLDEELLIAKEVSVRLHSELEKSEESRNICEKFNRSLKQQLDLLKEALDEKSTNVSHASLATEGETILCPRWILGESR